MSSHPESSESAASSASSRLIVRSTSNPESDIKRRRVHFLSSAGGVLFGLAWGDVIESMFITQLSAQRVGSSLSYFFIAAFLTVTFFFLGRVLTSHTLRDVVRRLAHPLHPPVPRPAQSKEHDAAPLAAEKDKGLLVGDKLDAMERGSSRMGPFVDEHIPQEETRHGGRLASAV